MRRIVSGCEPTDILSSRHGVRRLTDAKKGEMLV